MNFKRISINNSIRSFIKDVYNTSTNDKFITLWYDEKGNWTSGFSTVQYEIIFKESDYNNWFIRTRIDKINKIKERLQ